MKKAIIIDDEPLARSIVKEYLQNYPGIELVAECNDGFEGLKAIQLFQPELIFLDIQMPKINGFEMLELLSEPPAVIFTTAFDEYAIKAFENNTIDYLLKPFSSERFGKAMQKWMDQEPAPSTKKNTQALLETASQMPAQSQRIVVKTAGKIKIIPIEEVQYLEASDDYVKVITREGSFLKNKTMNHFEQTLDPQHFVRTHRSFIVNIEQVTRIDPYEKDGFLVLLKSGARVPVSKNGYAKLKSILGL
jgi:two-component system, LytTR family, response regulator